MDADQPIIRLVAKRRKTKASGLTGGGLSSMLSALSIAAEEMPFDKDELFRFLHVRIHTARSARRRASWIGGRNYNALSGQSAEYVPLTGTHLRQALSCIGLQAPEQVLVQGRYELRLDYAERAYDRLKSESGKSN